MADKLHRYLQRQWAFRQQILQSSHNALAKAPPHHPFCLFFGGSNQFLPFSMDRQLQEILRGGGRSDIVLNLGSFGFCDSGYVLETTRALLHSWANRQPDLLIYEVNPNEMPPVERESAPLLAGRQIREQLILDYDAGQRLSEALRRRPIELGANLERLTRLVRKGPHRPFPILLLDFESNIIHWAPSISAFSRSLSTEEAERARNALHASLTAFRNADWDVATRSLDECDLIDPEIALARYLRGRLAERDGQNADAWSHLEAARDLDLVRGRMISGVLAKDLATQCQQLDVSFVSVPQLLRSATDGRPPGFDLFMDWVHYRPEVHHGIALALAERIQKDRLLDLTGDPQALLPIPAGRDEQWAFVLFQTALDMLQMPPSPYGDERIAQARSYVEQACQLESDPEIAGAMEQRLELLVRERFQATAEQPPSTPTPTPTPAAANGTLEETVCSLLEKRFGVRVGDHELETDLRLLGVDSLSLLEILQALFEGVLQARVPTHELVLDNVTTVKSMTRLARRQDERARSQPSQHQRSTEHHRLRNFRRASSRPRSAIRRRPAIADDATLTSLLEQHFQTRAQDPCMSFLPTGQSEAPLRVSWRDLEAASRKAATGLKALGVTPGRTVLIMTGHDPMTIYAFVASLRLGAVPCILNTPSPKMSAEIFLETFGQIATNSEATAVLVGKTEREFVEHGLRTAGLADTISIADVTQLSTATEGPLPTLTKNPESLAILQHSSGTTGTKKGVALTHRAVLTQVRHATEALDLRADDRIASWLPLYHDMGLIACLVMPLATATPFWMMSPFDWVLSPDRLLTAITEERATLTWLPNFAFHFLADRVHIEPDQSFDLSSLRAVINCSEPVAVNAWQGFHSRFASAGLSRFANAASYAMAENVFAVTQSGIDGPGHIDYVRSDRLRGDELAVTIRDAAVETVAVPSCGRPIGGTEVSIVDEQGTALPERTVGEIRVRGDCLIQGYHNNPEATSRGFSEEGFLTGDLGYLSDGLLYVVGRRKDMIIVAGQNIYPHDVEATLGRISGIRAGRVAAFGLDTAATGTQRLVVLAEVQETFVADKEACRRLSKAARQALYDMVQIGVPDIVLVPRDSLRKSSSGKMSRSLIRDLYQLGLLPPLQPD